jgi:hypothetical protein
MRFSHSYTLVMMRALFLPKRFIRDFHHPLLPLSHGSILIMFSPSLLSFPLSRNLTYPSTLQMANTRKHNVNNENNQGNPPPPPTLEQVLIMQAQMLQTMQQTMVTMQNAQGNNATQKQQPRDKPGEFQRTKPLTFLHSLEPTDEDDWLRMTEKKLQVVQCSN